MRKHTNRFSESSAWVPTTRQYLSDSVKILGIVDTYDGLCFAHDPGHHTNADGATICIMNIWFSSSHLKKKIESRQVTNSPTRKGDAKYIIFLEDQAQVSLYICLLMRQVNVCHFIEADRFMARSKSTIGFPVFECWHYLRHTGLGKYFPSLLKGLYTIFFIVEVTICSVSSIQSLAINALLLRIVTMLARHQFIPNILFIPIGKLHISTVKN